MDLEIDEYVNMVEKKIRKRGNMISTWRSTVRQEKVGDEVADLLIQGNMRIKGFLMSRAFGWTTPDWETLAVVFSHKRREKASAVQLKKLVKNTESYMSQNDIKWSWLVYVTNGGFDDEATIFAKSLAKKEVGIMLVDLPTGTFVYNMAPQNRYGIKIFRP
jgi:hypothetical protein